jgi:hypothetical protein
MTVAYIVTMARPRQRFVQFPTLRIEGWGTRRDDLSARLGENVAPWCIGRRGIRKDAALPFEAQGKKAAALHLNL